MITHSPADALRAVGFRATLPRVAILSILSDTYTPLSVDEVHKALGRARIDRVTVYRTLQTFKKAGIVREVDLKRGHVLYELHDEHDHHHLVCVDCGATEDFVGCKIDSVAQAALKKSSRFVSITDHSLELFGRCKACA